MREALTTRWNPETTRLRSRNGTSNYNSPSDNPGNILTGGAEAGRSLSCQLSARVSTTGFVEYSLKFMGLVPHAFVASQFYWSRTTSQYNLIESCEVR